MARYQLEASRHLTGVIIDSMCLMASGSLQV